MPWIIDTFEKALAYPSELLRTRTLQSLADLDPSDPSTANLLSLASRYAPQMSEANQRRVKHLCRCLVQSSPSYAALHSLSGEEESSDSSESSVDWGQIAKAIGTTATSITGSALTYANQNAQRETQLKIFEAQQKAAQDALAKQQAAAAQAAAAQAAAAQAAAAQAAAAKSAATAPRPGLKPPSISKPMALWVKVLIGLLVAAIAAGGVMYWRKQALLEPATPPKAT